MVTDDKQVAHLTRIGMSAAEIGVRLGITARTVQRARKRCGIAQSAHKKMTAAELARAQSLLDDGCTVAEVARTLNRGYCTIRRHFPGYVCGPQEAAAFASMGRAAQRILRVQATSTADLTYDEAVAVIALFDGPES